MEVRPVRYFVAVAEEGSFGRAAQRVGVSQPAVSHGVALLEAELGARLFDRAGRRVALTPEGRDFLEPARQALAAMDGLPGRLDRSRGVVRGRLEIGTTDVASIYVLPRVYRAFRTAHPEVDLSVRVEGTESLLRQLDAGTIELAVITMAVGDLIARMPSDSIRAVPLFREDLLFVVSGRNALAGRRRVPTTRLAEEPLITFKTDSITRRAVDRFFAEAGVTPRVAMEMSSPEAIKKLVQVGLGAGVLPSRSVRTEIRSGTLAAVPVRGGGLTRVLGIARDARRTPSPAAEVFARMTERIRSVRLQRETAKLSASVDSGRNEHD
ncbi:MAG: LysR family transcriptional regulator [Gemmatimonadota bacterium]|nr:LysR family transcriptional regulator [Gemmatimonadota bacterium]